MKKRVALISGGCGFEREISLLGARFFLSSVDREKYEIIDVQIDKDGAFRLRESDTAVYPVRLKDERGLFDGKRVIPIDIAFPLLHGDFGEDGKIQGALDCADIDYVGCGVLSGSLCADKIFTKIAADSLGIPTVPWILRCDSRDCPDTEGAKRAAEENLGFPVFIKPAGLGSSFGASPALCEDDFEAAYLNALKYSDRILIEKMLSAPREIELGVLISEGERIIPPPGEVLSAGFYSYSKKYLKSDTKIVPKAILTPGEALSLRDYAERLLDLIPIKQLSRIDFFISEGKIYLNEINTMPGFTEGSLYPLMMAEAGIGHTELITRLIEGAVTGR